METTYTLMSVTDALIVAARMRHATDAQLEDAIVSLEAAMDALNIENFEEDLVYGQLMAAWTKINYEQEARLEDPQDNEEEPDRWWTEYRDGETWWQAETHSYWRDRD